MIRRALAAAGVLAGLAVFVWADLAWRSRAAWLEGEKYLEWHLKPELQRGHWDAWLKAETARLDAEAAAGRISAEERRWRGDLAKAERDERVAESPLKYAVRWFETASELFSPPPSPWSRRARARLSEARALWSAELAASNLKLEDFAYR